MHHITITNPCKPTLLDQSVKTRGFAAEAVVQKECKKEKGNICVTFKLLPLAILTCGNYSAEVQGVAEG